MTSKTLNGYFYSHQTLGYGAYGWLALTYTDFMLYCHATLVCGASE
jgi:hypothetical protein